MVLTDIKGTAQDNNELSPVLKFRSLRFQDDQMNLGLAFLHSEAADVRNLLTEKAKAQSVPLDSMSNLQMLADSRYL